MFRVVEHAYCFRSQRYKTFESYSQRIFSILSIIYNCFRSQRYKTFESYSQPPRQILEQFAHCFRSQRYKTFESYSQLAVASVTYRRTVSDRKDTKLLKAIHNSLMLEQEQADTVSDRKDTKLLKAIHN